MKLERCDVKTPNIREQTNIAASILNIRTLLELLLFQLP